MKNTEVEHLELASDDPDAKLEFIALSWDDEIKAWRMISLGRTLDEIEARVSYWAGKGAEGIEVFQLTRISNE